ncbi:MAG: ParA family protein [Bacteroidota bacterium]|nr:ParA family protein [Bacteroidota bacterium]
MIIALANHKGGTGKTTSTINIGRALSTMGKKILLVDLDPQGNLSYSLGLGNEANTIIDLLSGNKTFNETACESNGMHIIPSNTGLNEYAARFEKTKDAVHALKKTLAPIRSLYDFILIDCPPAMSVYTLNALNAAEGVIIPLLLEVLSVQGLDQVLREISKIQKTTNPDLQIIGALGTIVNESRRLSSEVLEYIRDNYKLHVFNNHVRNNVKAAEAPSFAATVIDYAPTSTSARDYISIAQELLKILEYHVASSEQSRVHQPSE